MKTDKFQMYLLMGKIYVNKLGSHVIRAKNLDIYNYETLI
jgi:hypothetical protein